MNVELPLGFAIGIIMALTGAGGGILGVPLLVFGAAIPVAKAAPMALLAVSLSACLGASLGLRAGIVRYRAAMLMATVGMSLAPLGVWLARRTDHRLLTALFALVLFYVAYRSFRQATEDGARREGPGTDLPCIHNEDSGRLVWTSRCARVLALDGGLAGLLSGLLGVGGGFVVVPALKHHTNLAMQSIVATSLTVIFLVSLSGVVSNALTSGIDWGLALPFAGGSLGGMLFGRLLAGRVQARLLQKAFAALSAVVALGMLLRALAS